MWLRTWRTSTSCLPLAANSGQYFATGANGSSRPRSISISAASAVTFLVLEKTLTIVFSDHSRVFGFIGVPAPDIDDEFTVDVDGDSGAEFAAAGDLVGQCGDEVLEAAVVVTVQNTRREVGVDQCRAAPCVTSSSPTSSLSAARTQRTSA